MMFRRTTFAAMICAASSLCGSSVSGDAAEKESRLQIEPKDHVVLIGNTLAERMQYYGNFEALLHSRFPRHELYVRNLGWSADELTLRLRSKDFQDHGHNLADHQADVILACFGFNESFAGPAGLPKFESDLDKFLKDTLAARYNGKSAPRVALISPILHENLGDKALPDGSANNKNIELYAAAIERAAQEHGVTYIDLFHPTQKLMQAAVKPAKKLTFNGIHLNEQGDAAVALLLDEALFGPAAEKSRADREKLLAEVNEKNRQFYYDYRAVNGYYIYGGRKNPFGVVNFPDEFKKLRAMIANRDRRVWAVAQGKSVPATIDDSQTGELPKIETNMKTQITITSPQDSLEKMDLAEGYEANLFASEVEFPDLKNPVQMTFDAKGRLWVATMPSYPQYVPGEPVDDKILILEDTNGDGRADKQTVFADKLYLPTGLELLDGGVYVAQEPNLMFLKDTDGDDRADVRKLVLHGFDSADSHHAIHAFARDPSGALYFGEGTFHQSAIETPYGPRRLSDAGFFRYEPRSQKLDVWVSYRFANPWGETFDRWGQYFVADASTGFNYFGTAFSGEVEYPTKHGGMKQILTKQWRPTAGCEFVSSRNFPDEAQGNYLLNNCIGFQGILQYKMKEDGAGMAADPVDPLLRSSDPNFRPVDIEFGPDGALYIVDWFNPLVGHMQHSIRDPNRDRIHGRVWRIRYKDRPLVEPAKIAGQPLPALFEQLKTYEDRTRYRSRLEIRERDTEQAIEELERWVAGLDKNDADYQHNLLEALWVYQGHGVVNEALLKQLLRSPDFRARAAATRVLFFWRDRISEVFTLLRQQLADEHPRVRLEVVRALAAFRDQEAMNLAVESLAYPQDAYLTYVFNETMQTLNKRVPAPTGALAKSGAAAPLMRLLADGKLPSDRVSVVVEMLCQRGGPEELAYLFREAVQPKTLGEALRGKIFEGLLQAAEERKVKPTGDLSPIEALARGGMPGDRGLQTLAVQLAAAWKVEGVADELQALASSEKVSPELQRTAIEALARLGTPTTRGVLEKLTQAGSGQRVRYLAAAALSKVDVGAAAQRAAAALAEAEPSDNPAPVLDAFFERRGGSEKLAQALAEKKLPVDVAKIALRYMYSVGHSDKQLSDVLSKAAGIASDPAPPTQEEVAKLSAEVASHGNAARGEVIFRRADISCMKCHAVSKAGGNVGPELSAVGSISPVEYIVNSILNPDMAIKEQYVTRIFVTTTGAVYSGIVVDRSDVRVRVRDAAGKTIIIPTADIDEEAEGKSLMPKGLTKFLTHQEFLDLSKFVSELGRPGQYAIPNTPSIQRWRVLQRLPKELAGEQPSDDLFRKQVLGARDDRWTTAYAKVNGGLPLEELIAGAKGPTPVFVQGEIDVTQAGPVELRLTAPAGTSLWIDNQPHSATGKITTNLTKGKHRVTIRVVATPQHSQDVKVEVAKPAGSGVKYETGAGV